MKRFLYMLLAFVLVLTGCTDETPIPPSIETGGDITIYIGDSVKVGAKVLPEGSNQKLQFYLSQDGQTDVSSYIQVDENGILHALAMPSDPEFKLWIYSPSLKLTQTVSVTLKMDPNGGIASLSTDKMDLPTSDETTVELVVTRKTENTSFYEIGDHPSWVEITRKSSSELTDTYDVRIYQNLTGEDRSGKIVFGSMSVSVYQPMKAFSIGDGSHEIVVGNQITMHPGETAAVDACIMPEGSDQSLKYSISASGLSDEEVASFINVDEHGYLKTERIWDGPKTFVLRIYSPVYGISKDVTVSLELDPSASLELNVLQMSFSYDDRESRYFDVSVSNDAYLPYTVTTDSDWIHVEKSQENSYAVSVDVNQGSEQRNGTISVGDSKISVVQEGRYYGPSVPREIVLDGVSPNWDGKNLWLENEYIFSFHVLPLSAPQDIVLSIHSRGTSSDSGAKDKIVKDKDIPLLIELDKEKSSVKPIATGADNWSRNYVLVATTSDGTISMETPFTIGQDINAGVSGVDVDIKKLESPDRTDFTVNVQKKTAASTNVVASPSDNWISARMVKTLAGGKEETWEISVAQNMTKDARKGKVVFWGNNGTKTTVTVEQPGNISPGRYTEWVYGVVPPKEEDYVRYPDKPYYFEIYENLDPDVDQGWYLATKSSLSYDPPSHHLQDSNLCWAYTASNAIHWWYGHNEKYIKEFMRLNPEIANPDNPVGNENKNARMNFTYDKNAEYVKDKSAIVRIYTERHNDLGDNPSRAVRDVLFVPRNTGAATKEEKGNRDYPGWFYPVFGLNYSKVLESTVIGVETQEKKFEEKYRYFETVVNEALLGKKSMMLAVHYDNVGPDGGDHAINLWGVTYDENGRIVELIIGDNNLHGSDGMRNRAYLTNYAVSYGDGRINIHSTGQDKIGPPMGYVNEIYSLGLGTEYWEDWAESNNLHI